jgi:hypothetical protein
MNKGKQNTRVHSLMNCPLAALCIPHGDHAATEKQWRKGIT